jgi:hypothetical protein
MERYIRIKRESLDWVTDWTGTDPDSELRSEQAERVKKKEEKIINFIFTELSGGLEPYP